MIDLSELYTKKKELKQQWVPQPIKRYSMKK